MSYNHINTEKSEKSIVQTVMVSKGSQLLIPPNYKNRHPEITEPEKDLKYIGLFSSGSTGKPKCIWNSYRNLVNNGKYSFEAFEIVQGQKLLILAKPWHVAGLSWALMAEEFDCEYQFFTTNRGEQDKWLERIQHFKPDVLLTVPPVLASLQGEKWFVPKIIFGGLPFQKSEFEKMEAYCEVMIQGYGMTEAGGLISCHHHVSGDAFFEEEYLCNGVPIKGVEIKCMGSEDNPEEVFIRSETAYTHSFYPTGDLGYKDEKGKIYLTGRKEQVTQKKYD